MAERIERFIRKHEDLRADALISKKYLSALKHNVLIAGASSGQLFRDSLLALRDANITLNPYENSDNDVVMLLASGFLFAVAVGGLIRLPLAPIKTAMDLRKAR